MSTKPAGLYLLFKRITPMDRYETYALQDFLGDDDFIRWVKYPDSESDRFWQTVLKTFPHQADVIEQARGLAKGLTLYHPVVADGDVNKVKQVLLSSIGEKRETRNFAGRLMKVAAVVALLIMTGWWLNSRRQMASAAVTGNVIQAGLWQEVRNDGTEISLVSLADGSTIKLRPGSQIRYRLGGDESSGRLKKREVSLEGEAFFEVAKDPENPFFVYANGLVTRVIGTSFTITAYKNQEAVRVEVSTGKVAVYSDKPGSSDAGNGGLVITPNQQVVFQKNEELFRRGLVEKPRILVSPERIKMYTYTDAPVASIFKALEQVYGIRIRYDADRFRACHLNMELSDESLYEKLDLISKVLDADYEVEGVEVVFRGAGCHD